MRRKRRPANLAAAVATVRCMRGISQEQLAKAAAVSKTSVAALEQGRKVPRAHNLQRIAAALSTPLGTLQELASLLAAILQGAPAGAHSVPALDTPDLRHEVARLFADAVGATAAEISPEQAQERARALWAKVEGWPQEAQKLLVAEARDCRTDAFCELLCDQSRRAAGDSAERALHLARLAVVAACVATAAGGGEGGFGVQAYAQGHLSNALRVAGLLLEADLAFAHSAALWQASPVHERERLNEARLLHLEASLRNAQGRHHEALALLDRALAIDRWGESPELLMSKVIALEDLGDFHAAIDLIHQAGAAAGDRCEPRQRFLISAHLAGNLCFLGRHDEAEGLIPEVRALARQLGNDLDLLRVLWIEGQVAAGLGRDDEAAAKLGQVRTELLTRGIAYDAALVTLELAQIHAAAGRTAEVKALARESAAVFHAQAVHHEAQAACELFREAAEHEAATVAVIRQVIVYLHRAQDHPHLRFEICSDPEV
jgi:transcriptional regulator with XRE-family HTH domain